MSRWVGNDTPENRSAAFSQLVWKSSAAFIVWSDLCGQSRRTMPSCRRAHIQRVRFAPTGGFPSRLGVSPGWRSLTVMPAAAVVEIGFELGNRQTLPLLGLIQQGPALSGPEGRSLTGQ